MNATRFISIFALLLSLAHSELTAQDLDSLKTADYSNQQKLLIKNEVRKVLGDKANSPEVKELTLSLIPWAMLEEIEPIEFARDIFLFTKAKDAGISFTTVEDLIPILPKFKGDETDFVFLALSMHEAEKSELPAYLRDKLVSGVIQRKWDGLSALTAMRILILSRSEKKNSEEVTDLLWKRLPGNLRSISKEKGKESYQEITSSFVNVQNVQRANKMGEDLQRLHSLDKKKIESYISISKRNLNEDFSILGDAEMKERPKLEWTALDIEGPKLPDTEQPSDWRTISLRVLNEIVNSWIGTKYVYGASSKSGTDCSGFTRSVLTDRKIAVPGQLIPRSARDQAKIGTSTVRNQLRAGDLVFFSASPNQSKITHVGLSLGADRFVHASSSRGVIIQSLDEKWWTGRFTSARRIFTNVGK